MKIIKDNLLLSELKEMADKGFGNLVKAVVDVEKGIMAVDAELHSDEEAFLLENGSEQKNLWGINLYPQASGDNFIEFDSMINIKPAHGNRSREVVDSTLREKIKEVIEKLVS